MLPATSYRVFQGTRLLQKQLMRNVLAAGDAALALDNQQVRHSSRTPYNTVVMFVPQQEAWVVERMGKFHRIMQPGLNIMIPFLDTVKYVQNLKEMAIDIPKQSAITSDNVTLNIDGVLYLIVEDPYKSSYGVDDPEFAITQLAQTTMRSELGKRTLDHIFRERETLNAAIVESINRASECWGIQCRRYEIKDIKLPTRVHEAMQMQVEAERKKRAVILQSEGERASEINIAEGRKQAQILASEAFKAEYENKAKGEALALIAKADAKAKSLNMISSALNQHNGLNAASLNVAEQYVTAFEKLASTNNTLILPSNTGDVTSMVTQAMCVYQKLTSANNPLQQQQPDATAEDAAGKRLQQLGNSDHREYFSDDEESRDRSIGTVYQPGDTQK